MNIEMGVLTRYEVEKLMKKASRERARVIRELCEKAYALNVGEEMFQCYISCLPTASELQQLLNESSTCQFKVWPTLNGTIIKREA